MLYVNFNIFFTYGLWKLIPVSSLTSRWFTAIWEVEYLMLFLSYMLSPVVTPRYKHLMFKRVTFKKKGLPSLTLIKMIVLPWLPNSITQKPFCSNYSISRNLKRKIFNKKGAVTRILLKQSHQCHYHQVLILKSVIEELEHVHLQCYVCHNAFTATLASLNIDGYGWKVRRICDGVVIIVACFSLND